MGRCGGVGHGGISGCAALHECDRDPIRVNAILTLDETWKLLTRQSFDATISPLYGTSLTRPSLSHGTNMTPQDPASDSERNRLVRLANLDHVAAGESRSTQSSDPSSSGFSGRWTRRQWAQASLLATGAALVFALVPGFSSAMQPRSGDAHVATMALPLPPAPAPAQDDAPA